ncbi:MAG: hypothetical protein WBA97_07450 [Actinophytocola sp.]|uniref:hypothetical protein n=1 Tax=Actinophytocola sp. TaxID=1872138 RepID=UPI003C769B0F
MNMPTSDTVSCEVPAYLLSAWEAVYRDYVSTHRVNAMNVRDREVQAQLSARVAVAWRRLAEAPQVEWWLVAALSTAAEAMEQQARDWATRGRRSA